MDLWETEFAEHVRSSAKDHAAIFLEFVIQRAKGHPEALPIFSAAMTDMADWYLAQAAGLQAVLDLRRIAAGSDAG